MATPGNTLPPRRPTAAKPKPDAEARAKEKAKADRAARTKVETRLKNYGLGAFFVLLGVGLMVWYSYTMRAPGKLFNLLAAGGIASLLSGIGLFVQPLDDERLDAFQNEPNPIAVFKVMPTFWKVWMVVIAVAMGLAFWYVSATTVRVGR